MFGIILLFATPMIAPAQDACPSLSVSASSQYKGEATFSGNLYGGDFAISPKFKWTVSAGKIAGGQGSISITVKAPAKTIVTGTLEVEGYPPACDSIRSETIEVSAVSPAPVVASKCPALSITGTSPGAGAALFRAKLVPTVKGATWAWQVSAGKIVSGQGTAAVTLAAPAGKEVMAHVTVDGLPGNCGPLADLGEVMVK